MMWKILFVAIFAIGALADEVADLQKKLLEPFLKEECKKGPQDKVDEIVRSLGAYVEATANLISHQAIQGFKDARKNGTVNEVSKMYCERASGLKSMIDDLKSKVLPCLEEIFKDNFAMPTDAKLIDYLCYEDGSRITQFVTNEGIECVQSQTKELSACGESLSVTNLNYILENSKPDILSEKFTESIKEQCANLEMFTSCAVKEMEACPLQTPAHIADSLFKFILSDASLCKNVK